MGWSIGFDNNWNRDIGYGVPCICDHPECNEEIDRGLAHVCGGEPYGGENGCGLFFCGKHLLAHGKLCERCANGNTTFDPKPDTQEWIDWKLNDQSWEEWRSKNKEWVERHSLTL